MGTAIIPNLDSIAEFRILTSNFDAEYGEFSGGQINVITKSGSNILFSPAIPRRTLTTWPRAGGEESVSALFSPERARPRTAS